MIVGIKALQVLLFDGDGTLVAEHPRAYGKAPTDSTEPARQLPLLCLKPGGWPNSRVRADLPEDLRAYMDAMSAEELKPLLRMMRDEQASAGCAAIQDLVIDDGLSSDSPQLIQASLNMDDGNMRERELRALHAGMQRFGIDESTIVTMDEEG